MTTDHSTPTPAAPDLDISGIARRNEERRIYVAMCPAGTLLYDPGRSGAVEDIDLLLSEVRRLRAMLEKGNPK